MTISKKKMVFSIPRGVLDVVETLEKAHFKAYVIGGCVRDLLISRKPNDWDITTNAKPEQIIKLFPKTFYENVFGTVGVVNETIETSDTGVPDKTLEVIEVTPFRREAKYSDYRRPDSVIFSEKLEDDLQRRDFTVNALALRLIHCTNNTCEVEIIDEYKGEEDLQKKIVRAVGDPDLRFKEDALRLLRAVRIATELDFTIEEKTEKAIQSNGDLLSHIAEERVRDEFIRILQSDNPAFGLKMAQKLGILRVFLPELEKGIGIEQNKAHAYNVWEHLMKTVQHAAKKSFPLEVRLAALFHDIGKPPTRRKGVHGDWTFYGHDVVGARMTKKIMERLKFSSDIIEKVVKLVRWHMFFSDTETITLSAVRRMVSNVGKDLIWSLMNVRICDRIGTGRPKESPYRLRKYKAMIEEAMHDPVTVGMLMLKGGELLEITEEKPGPRIGFILHALLEEILENPKLNTSPYLKKKASELSKLNTSELQKLGEKGKDRKESIEEETIGEIRKKYWVE